MSVGKHQDWLTDGIPQRRCRWTSQPRGEVFECLSGKANGSFQYNFHYCNYFQTMKISSRVWDLLQITFLACIIYLFFIKLLESFSFLFLNNVVSSKLICILLLLLFFNLKVKILGIMIIKISLNNFVIP